MKKRWMLALMLIACLAALSACKSDDGSTKYNVLNGGNTQNQNSVVAPSQPENADEPVTEDEYDPRAEEDDYQWEYITAVPQVVTATPAPTIRSEYAGATPVVIDPIDKPTPTPAPPLNIANYKAYDATKLGLSFEGPVGWTIDDTQENAFSIQNPDTGVNYKATLTVRAEKVDAQYTEKQLQEVVKSMLDAIKTAGFKSYSTSNTDNRSLLGKTGVYANYDGVLIVDGKEVEIGGRVMAACVDKVLYTIHITFPSAYEDEYIDKVFHHLRDTIKITK